MEGSKSSHKHTCLPLTQRRGGFSAQLADMIHLRELSSLHRTATHTSVSLFGVRAAVDQHWLDNKPASMDAVPHVSHKGSCSVYYSA